MIIAINDNKCFMCDSIIGITRHHALPARLNSKNNIIIPICDKCHERINRIDASSVISHIYTMADRMKDCKKELGVIVSAMKKYDGGKFIVPEKSEGDDCNGNG